MLRARGVDFSRSWASVRPGMRPHSFRGARARHLFFSMENPLALKIWSWRPLVKVLERFTVNTVYHVDTDYCSQGTPCPALGEALPALRHHVPPSEQSGTGVGKLGSDV